MAIGKNIKGITIEFSGDTTKLGKAMESIRKDAKSVDAQLKQVNNALKFNPKNTELLAQKQQLLGQKVDLTKNKLNALREAQAKMDADPSVDKTSQDYMELRREIIVTESQLRNFTKQLKEVENIKFTQVGEGLQKIGGKMQTVGDKMTQKVTAPLTGIGAIAAKIGLDFDAQMSKVAAIAGATGDDFDKLRDKAREMGKATKFTATESAEAFEYMAMAGWKTDDMLKGIEPILQLATASGADLATTSDIVTDALTAFGLTADDTAHFADVLAAASTNANTNVEMMGETFKYAAPVAGALGYSVDDVAVAIGLMANSGIKASSAGTALRTLFTNLANPTDEMAAAMETLGVSLDDGEGNLKSFKEVMDDLRAGFGTMKMPAEEFTQQASLLDSQLADGTITEKQYNKQVEKLTNQAYGAEGALKAQAAAQLAGKTGMSGLLAIVNASEADYQKLTTAVENCDGATGKMADTMMDNAKGGITVMISALQNAGIAISDVLAPFITKAAKAIENLANKFSDLSPETQKMILIFAGIAAAIGPVLIVIGKLATGIGAIIKILPMLGSAFTVLTGPVGLVIAAIAAAIAIGVLLYKNWDKIKEKAGKLKEYVIGAFKALKEGVKRLFGDIKDAMVAPIEAARDLIKGIIKKIKGFFNFDFKLPDLKTPHFTIDPPGWSIGDLLHGVIPSLDVDWYAQGGIFRSPSVIGVGEAGPEAVLPIEKLQGMLASMADSIVNGILTGNQLQAAGTGGEIVIKNYLYPSGPQMGEQTVKMYDQYKKILG